MRIVSPYRDYYDHVMQHGVDQSVVYVRYPKTIETPNYTINGYRREFHICGRYYPAISKMSPKGVMVDFAWASLRPKTYYTFDEYMEDHLNTNVWDKKDLQRFFTVHDHQHERSRQYNIEHDSPIVMFHLDQSFPNRRTALITLNPRLSEFEFQRIIDPYTMYQNVDMFVSGVLSHPSNPPVQVKDKDMIVKKGFDSEYGFRKRPKT